MRKIIIPLVILILWLPCFLHAEESMGIKIAVLPFEVFSIEQETELGAAVAKKLSRQLAQNPYVLTSDFQSVQSIMREDAYDTLGEQKLQTMARLLEANFLVFGSLTKIRNEISIDVQIFNNFPLETYFKTFAEGTDIDALAEDIASKIELEVMEKSEFIPPAQRPKLTLQQGPAAVEGLQQTIQTDAIDAELARELGLKELDVTIREKTPARIEPQPEAAETLQEDHPDVVDIAQKKQVVISQEQIEGVSDNETIMEGEQSTAEAKVPEGTLEEVIEKEAATADAEDPLQKKDSRSAFSFDKPVNINADTMEYDNKKNRALFKGNVVARQGDITMFADTMEVLYRSKGGLRKLSALGNVKVIQGERIATGQKIVFYNDQQKIVATGNPRVWQGDNVIYGKKITVYLKEDRSVVEGGAQDRASATIYPRKKKPKK